MNDGSDRHLVFLVAIGVVDQRFVASVGWCVESLRGAGCFDGDIAIITDPASERLLASAVPTASLLVGDPERLWNPEHNRIPIQRFQMARLSAPELIDLEAYDTVMYLDVDILAIGDVRPLFDGVEEFRYAREFAPMSGPAYSGTLTDDEMADARFRRGINSGTFVVPAAQVCDVFEHWRTGLNRSPDQLCYDQPILNALVLRRQIDAAPMPPHAVAFPLLANFGAHVSGDTVLLHYCGGPEKFDLMEAHHRLLQEGRSPEDVIAVTVDDVIVDEPAPPRPSRPPMTVGVDDRLDTVDSTSLVNQALAVELARFGHRLVPEGAGGGRPDVMIHHNLKRDFLQNEFVDGVPHVAIRTWDFGPYPRSWAERINDSYEQLWVATEWIHRNAIDGGVDPSLIRRVPYGVDTSVFRPIGPEYPLPTEKRFRFMFVGGSVVRKGIDVLLAAYREAFTRADDVCLVIKDHSRNVFYEGRNAIGEIRDRAADPDGPEIILIDDHLDVEQLASLYRAVDVGVWPYRAEGFVLPALESLACGTPTMVPRIGPTSDFSTSRTSFLLPAREIDVPYHRSLRLALGFDVDVEGIRTVETRVDELVNAMRSCVETSPIIHAEKAAHAVAVAHLGFSRRRFGELVESMLAEVVAG